MAYIERTDFNRVLPDLDKLDYLTEGDDTIWEQAALAAIAEIRSALNGRYDTTRIFSATGDARLEGDGAIVLLAVLRYTVANIYLKVMPDAVPESISQMKEDVRLWLKDVKLLKENPILPTKTAPQQDYIRYGGQTKRKNNLL